MVYGNTLTLQDQWFQLLWNELIAEIGDISSIKPYICGSSYMLRMSNYKKEHGAIQ